MFPYRLLELLDEVVHSHNTVDISRVISKEDTSKSSKGTHEIGPEGDGGLDTPRVSRRHHDTTTGHDDSSRVMNGKKDIIRRGMYKGGWDDAQGKAKSPGTGEG